MCPRARSSNGPPRFNRPARTNHRRTCTAAAAEPRCGNELSVQVAQRPHAADRDAPPGVFQLVTHADGAQGEEPDTMETGMWLGRSARVTGIGVAALRLLLAEAAGAGARLVVAETEAHLRR
jgi:hypothetical protein